MKAVSNTKAQGKVVFLVWIVAWEAILIGDQNQQYWAHPMKQMGESLLHCRDCRVARQMLCFLSSMRILFGWGMFSQICVDSWGC